MSSANKNATMTKIYEVMIMVGSFLTFLPTGFPLYYGNMAPYIISYFKFQVGPAAFNVSTDWFLSIFIIMLVLSHFTTDWILTKINFLTLLIASALVGDVSLMLTRFTVQYSVGATMVTFMLITGFTTGNVIMLSFITVRKVSEKYVGIKCAFASSGISMGAFFVNFITRIFINPDNLSPDVHGGGLVFFSQASLLAQVPDCFLVLGFLFVGIHAAGISLVHSSLWRLNKIKNESQICDLKSDERNRDQREHDNFKGQCSRINYRPNHYSQPKQFAVTAKPIAEAVPTGSDEERISINFNYAKYVEHQDNNEITTNEKLRHLGINDFKLNEFSLISKQTPKLIQSTNADNVVSKLALTETNTIQATAETTENNAQTNESSTSVKPTEMLRTPSFYTLWISLAAINYSSLVTQNFYKQYAEIYIKDDAFLTFVGSLSNISMVVIRFSLGILLDWKGIKITLMTVLSINGILAIFWYITPRINRWLYLVVCVVAYGVQGTIHFLASLSTLKLYGLKYYATNCGFVMTANLAASFVSTPIFAPMLEAWGWFGIAAVSAIWSVAVLLCVVIFMPPN